MADDVSRPTVSRETAHRPRRDCQYPAAAPAPAAEPCPLCAMCSPGFCHLHAAAAFEPPRATLGDREAREYGVEPLDATTAPAFAKLGRTCRQCGEPVITVLETRTHCPDPLDAVIVKGQQARVKARKQQIPALAEDRFAADQEDEPSYAEQIEDVLHDVRAALDAALQKHDLVRSERDVLEGRCSYLEGEVLQLRDALRLAQGRR